MRTMTSFPTLLLALAAGLTLSPTVATGQDGEELRDSRWLPYLGCWVESHAPEGPLTCVVPEGEGVAFLTVYADAPTERYSVIADGGTRSMDIAGCEGTVSFRFAPGSSRAYTTEAVTCDDGTGQRTRGLFTFTGPDQWVQILAPQGGGEGVAWTKRYETAPTARVEAAGLSDRVPSGRAAQTVQSARQAAAGRITVDEIIEAHASTDTEVVRAWIAEQGEPLRLDADQLIRLADAGVDGSVIDVAVAVSYPDRFNVSATPAVYQGSRARYGYNRWDSCGAWSPFGYQDPYCFSYDRYRYSRFGYSRFGYHRTGYGYGPDPVIVVVRPTSPRTRPGGSLVRGRGYTQPGASDRPAAPRGRFTAEGRSRPGSDRGSVRSTGSRPDSKGKAKPRGG